MTEDSPPPKAQADKENNLANANATQPVAPQTEPQKLPETPISPPISPSTQLLPPQEHTPIAPLLDHKEVLKPKKFSFNRLLLLLKPRPISPSSAFFRYWTAFITFVYFLQLLLFPVMMAWTNLFMTPGWLILSAIIDVLHLLNVHIQTQTVIKDNYGKDITDLGILRKNYILHAAGWMEILFSLPWDFLAFVPVKLVDGRVPIVFEYGADYQISLYQYKLAAIIRFGKMVLRAPYRKIYEIHIPGLALTLCILMYLGHLDACVFWTMENILKPPNRWVDLKYLIYRGSDYSIKASYSTTGEVFQVPFSTQYLTSYITALRCLVLKLRDVYVDAENLYVILEFIAGILSYGTVFGNIHSIVEMLDHDAASTEAEERRKYETKWLRDYMKSKSIPSRLQRAVIDYREIQWKSAHGLNEATLFDDIPKGLQQEVKNFLYLDLIKKVPLFKDEDENFHSSIAMKIQPMIVLDGWHVFHKGDDANEMYFIKSGSVNVENDEGRILVNLGTGQFFGEIALFDAGKRTAHVRACGLTELCIFRKEDFDYIMQNNPIIAERLRESVRLRKETEARLKAEAEAKKAAAAAAASENMSSMRLNDVQASRRRLRAFGESMFKMSTHKTNALGEPSTMSLRPSAGPTPGQSTKELPGNKSSRRL